MLNTKYIFPHVAFAMYTEVGHLPPGALFSFYKPVVFLNIQSLLMVSESLGRGGFAVRPQG